MSALLELLKRILGVIPQVLAYLAGKRGEEAAQAEQEAQRSDDYQDIASRPDRGRRGILERMRDKKL